MQLVPSHALIDINPVDSVNFHHPNGIECSVPTSHNNTDITNANTTNTREANPCDYTNESNDSRINKKEGQYFDLNEVDVFILSQQNSEEFHSAKIEDLTKWKNFEVYTEVDDIGQNRITGRWVCT